MKFCNYLSALCVVMTLCGCKDLLLPEFYTPDVQLSVSPSDEGPIYNVSVTKDKELELQEVHVFEEFQKTSFRYYDIIRTDYNLGTELTYNSRSDCYKGDTFNAFAYVVTPNGKYRSNNVTYTQGGEVPTITSSEFVFNEGNTNRGTLYLHGSGFPREISRIQYSSTNWDALVIYDCLSWSDGNTLCFKDCKVVSYKPVELYLKFEDTVIRPIVKVPGPTMTEISATEMNLGDIFRVTLDEPFDKDNIGYEPDFIFMGQEGNDNYFIYENPTTWESINLKFYLYDKIRSVIIESLNLKFNTQPWEQRQLPVANSRILTKIGNMAYFIGYGQTVHEYNVATDKVTTHKFTSDVTNICSAVSDNNRYIYAAYNEVGKLLRYDTQTDKWEDLNYSGNYMAYLWMDGDKLRIYSYKKNQVVTYDTSTGTFSTDTYIGYEEQPIVLGTNAGYVYLTFDGRTIMRYPVGHPSSLTEVAHMPLYVDAGRIEEGKLYIMHRDGRNDRFQYFYSIQLDDISNSFKSMKNEGTIGFVKCNPGGKPYRPNTFEVVSNRIVNLPYYNYEYETFYIK